MAQKNTEAIAQQPNYHTGAVLVSRYMHVYCRFVPNYAQLASLLNKKRKKGERLRLDLEDVEFKAADVVKEGLITPPVLALPRL